MKDPALDAGDDGRPALYLSDAAIAKLLGIGKDRWRANAIVLERSLLMTLGLTSDGYPKHPLYLAADTPLSVYRDFRDRAP